MFGPSELVRRKVIFPAKIQLNLDIIPIITLFLRFLIKKSRFFLLFPKKALPLHRILRNAGEDGLRLSKESVLCIRLAPSLQPQIRNYWGMV